MSLLSRGRHRCVEVARWTVILRAARLGVGAKDLVTAGTASFGPNR